MNKQERISERTAVGGDGRVRYHGQGHRGAPKGGVLDEQDLDYAMDALRRAKEGLVYARSDAMQEMPRAQREDAKRAALAQADFSRRFVEEVLERNNYREDLHPTPRKIRR